jgi:tRNA threonylcarbamoyladenosine biosynthesis protein TsaB
MLVIETSDRIGQVAIAEGPSLLREHGLNAARRHARDLAPAVADLLTAQGWRPRDIDAVVVSRGPGSYTGLRVGVMSAKTFAHATGCRLLAIDTFAAIALQTPPDHSRVDVLADAQQDKVYFQPFARQGEKWAAAAPMVICPFADWLRQREPAAAATGPGLARFSDRIGHEIVCLPAAVGHPSAASLLRLALERWAIGDFDDPLRVEPLYLRPSSAEDQWIGRSP